MPEATPSTKLDAVNVILSNIGYLPINSLDGALTAEAAKAVQVLEEVDREVASRGWNFNTEVVTLSRNVDGRIPATSDVVQYRVSRSKYPSLDMTVRRGEDGELYLYDKATHTDILTQDLEAEVVYLLPFEDAPEPYRRYVTVRAARIMQDRAQGSQAAHEINMRDEVTAERWLKKHELSQKPRTVFDTYDAVRPLIRPYPRLRRI